jgi:hypothetical protein
MYILIIRKVVSRLRGSHFKLLAAIWQTSVAFRDHTTSVICQYTCKFKILVINCLKKITESRNLLPHVSETTDRSVLKERPTLSAAES